MHKEIERRFIVDKSKAPNIDKMQYLDITQGYIKVPQDSEYITRLRQTLYTDYEHVPMGEAYSLTIKGKGSLERDQFETIIWKMQFSKLWPAFMNFNIHKYRYHIPTSNKKYTVEYDIYKNELNGLYLAEVEFKTIHEAEEYIPEDWFSSEVTNNPDFSNYNLAIIGVPPMSF